MNLCVWNECVEMDDSTCPPVLSELRADTYRYINRPSTRCPLAGVPGSACATSPPRHHLAYLANVYRLLPITDSSKQQGLKHWQYHLEDTAGVTSRQV